MTLDDKLAALVAKIAEKRQADATKSAKARDEIARATTLPELKSALLRFLA